MILAYLIVSAFLSIVGALFYKIIAKDRLVAVEEKWLIYSIILFSLLGPVIGYGFINESNLSHSSYLISSVVNNQDCDQEEIFAECQRIEADGGFCDCDEIIAQNIVAYKANRFYEFASHSKSFIIAALQVFAVLVLLILFIRIGYLILLIKGSKQTKLSLAGIKLTKLINRKNKSVGSFKLIDNYIIWDNRLNELPNDEREAVLLHEVSHIKQKNTWELMVVSVLQMFWFVNPAVYFLKHELVRISEFIADEFAVNCMATPDKNWYASLILKLHESGDDMMISRFARSNIKDRIHQLVRQKERTKRSFAPIFLGMILVMSISAAGAISYVCSEQNMMNAYFFLQEKNQDTGRTVFCKDCIEYPNT